VESLKGSRLSIKDLNDFKELEAKITDPEKFRADFETNEGVQQNDVLITLNYFTESLCTFHAFDEKTVVQAQVKKFIGDLLTISNITRCEYEIGNEIKYRTLLESTRRKADVKGRIDHGIRDKFLWTTVVVIESKATSVELTNNNCLAQLFVEMKSAFEAVFNKAENVIEICGFMTNGNQWVFCRRGFSFDKSNLIIFQ